jgi:hypothetical protein
MHRIHRLPLVLLVAGLAACAAPAQEAPAPERPEGWVECTEPRPEVCTQEFRPVCALRDTGVRCVTKPCEGATERVTKPNGCDACSDPAVIGHRPGACDADGPAGRTMLDY